MDFEVGPFFRLLHTENDYFAVSGRFSHVRSHTCTYLSDVSQETTTVLEVYEKDRVEKKEEEEEKEKR